jgi:hypothetical protein
MKAGGAVKAQLDHLLVTPLTVAEVVRLQHHDVQIRRP